MEGIGPPTTKDAAADMAGVHSPAGRALAAMLMEAAGVAHLRVQKIVVTCESHSVVMFEVKLFGNEDRIHKVLTENEAPPRDHFMSGEP